MFNFLVCVCLLSRQKLPDKNEKTSKLISEDVMTYLRFQEMQCP